MTMLTIAEQVARLMGNDEQRWKAEDGRTLDQVAEDHGVDIEMNPNKPHLTRYVFDDGSAIIAAENGWDIEGSEPWSWQSKE